MGQAAEKRAGPKSRIIFHHRFPHGRHQVSFFIFRQIQRQLKRFSDLVDIVRIYDQGVEQLLRGAGKFTQNQNPAFLFPTGDIFLGNQVHAVHQRGHQGHISQRIQSAQFAEIYRLMHKMNRDVRNGGKLAVNFTDLHLHGFGQVPIGLHLPPGRHTDKDKHQVVTRAVAVQKKLDCVQATGNTLGIIQTFHTQDNLLVLIYFAVASQAVMEILRLQLLLKFGGVDADRIHPQQGFAVAVDDMIHL